MAAHPTVAPVPRMFVGLVDDAGLFPPEQLAMPDALKRHRQDLQRGNAVLTGRFVCPAARLGELRDVLARDGELRLSLIVTSAAEFSAAIGALNDDRRLSLAGVELSPGAVAETELADFVGNLVSAPAAIAAADIYVELPTGPQLAADLARIARVGASAKIRCGGVSAELFPSSRDLSRALALLARDAVSFKATAGLHHAVRYTDRVTGFTHHGFLNLLVAASMAMAGAQETELRDVLDSTDGPALAAAARGVDDQRAEQARALFVSYGSCSTGDPVTDLTELQLLE